MVLPRSELFFQGAESRLFHTSVCGQKAVVKERFEKKYRHSQLNEELNKQRFRTEVRHLLRCRSQGIDCPALLATRPSQGWTVMEKILGKTVAQFLKDGALNSDKEEFEAVARQVGQAIGRLHFDLKVVHGDLTTSNMMLRETPEDGSEKRKSPAVVLLDFGLSAASVQQEDRAVDLYVMERAVQSTHADCATEFNKFMLDAYAKEGGKEAQQTLRRLEDVRMRGRKRVAFG